MSWENALLMKLSNDVEKYEIEVTKMGQNYSFFLTVNLNTFIMGYTEFQCAIQVTYIIYNACK